MFRKGHFIIEDWLGPFEGWADDRKWNGFECPYFEFETAARMVDAWNNLAFGEGEYQAQYDEEKDAFYFRDGGLEEWDCFTAHTIDAEGRTIKAYPIGAFCWIWDVSNE